MTRLVDALASYVPTIVLNRIALADDSPLDSSPDRVFAAVMFADVAGSTALAERLAEQGAAGVEQLSHLFNAYFDQLIEVVASHGGDVASFAGDALLALWPVPRADDLAVATCRAAQCAAAVLSTLNGFAAGDEIRLSLHVGIGAGEVTVAYLGGATGRRVFVAAGPGVVQSVRAQTLAQGGDAVLSPEAWSLVQDRCSGDALPTDHVRLAAVHHPVPLTPLSIVAVPPTAEPALRSHLPEAILELVLAGHAAWLDELRRVTVLFVHLPDLKLTEPLDDAQQVVGEIQTILKRFEGSLLDVAITDKGPTALAAFGLPPLAHADDAVRGLRAALEMRAALERRRQPCSIGVATGRVFSGNIGNARRRAHTIVGDVVNLAARLMEVAAGAILVDAPTCHAARHDLAFEPAPGILVKGKAEPVAAFRLVDSAPRGGQQRSAMIGRQAEREALRERLRMLREGSSGGVVAIEGEPGIGKSRLIEDLTAQAVEDEIKVLVGTGDAIETSTPYYAWRAIFHRLFGLDEIPADPDAWRAKVLSSLTLDASSAGDAESQSIGTNALPPLRRLAPLLSAVIPVDWPENDYTAAMSREARTDNTRELLMRVLQRAAAQSPLLLVVEDVHWLDSASWVLLRIVSQRVRPIMVVLTSRPSPDAQPSEYRQILRDAGTIQLTLEAMPPEDIVALACQRLGVDALPSSVASLIQTRAEGHPFYAVEIAYALRDTGQIVIEGATCQIAPGTAGLRALDLPDTVQGIVTSRIDRLSSAEQLSLKVASVIGRAFTLHTLRDVHPIASEVERLPEHLTTMEHLDLVLPDRNEAPQTYHFKHAITQEVAYNLMLFAQRRQIHRRVADHYERVYAADLSRYYPLLAHHWSRALASSRAEPDVTRKTIAFLEKAGEQAGRNFADVEVVRFLNEAIRLDEDMRAPNEAVDTSTRMRRARWERELGEAYFRMGQIADARDHLQRALALWGQPAATTRGALVTSLLRQMTRQILHRMFPFAFLGRAPADARGALLEASRTYDLLALMSFIATERLASLVGYLRSHNLAEAAGPSPELVNSGAAMGILAGSVGQARLADGYFRRALETAQAIEDRHALARAWFSLGYHLVGRADWKQGRDAFDRAIEIYEQLGDLRWVELTRLNRANLDAYQGRFAHCLAAYRDVQVLAQRRGDAQAEAWALVGQSNMRLMLGETDEALRTLDELDRFLAHSFAPLSDPGSEIDARGIRALALVRRGDYRLAREAVEATLSLIDRSSTPIYHARTGYEHAATVALALWEAAEAGVSQERRAGAPLARRALQHLQRFAQIFRMARPVLWLRRGNDAWLRGNRAAAGRAWRRCLAEAEQLDMPYERALAHYEIGRHAPIGDPSRQRSLEEAIAAFGKLGAAYDLQSAQGAALASPVAAER